MKMILPALAVFCFAISGVGCQSTSSCCGSCGGEAHTHADGTTHTHGKEEKCCGKCKAEKE
ncbi:MAG: hypothetical protein AAGB26_14550 [Planctomycetota bacterium]